MPVGKGGRLTGDRAICVNEIPNRGLIDLESLPRTADANSPIVVHIAIACGSLEHFFSFVSVDGFGRVPRRRVRERCHVHVP